jgi:hypothetical protein
MQLQLAGLFQPRRQEQRLESEQKSSGSGSARVTPYARGDYGPMTA